MRFRFFQLLQKGAVLCIALLVLLSMGVPSSEMEHPASKNAIHPESEKSTSEDENPQHHTAEDALLHAAAANDLIVKNQPWVVAREKITFLSDDLRNESFTLSVNGGKQLTIHKKNLTAGKYGSSYTGTVVDATGEPIGVMRVAVVESADFGVNGQIELYDGTQYQLLQDLDGDVVVDTIDQRKYFSCGATATAEQFEQNVIGVPAESPEQTNITAADISISELPLLEPGSSQTAVNNVVKVMVAYTKTARQSLGSVAAMQALIENAVAVSNAAYEDSNIDLQLALVHTVEVNYDDSRPFAQHLYDLTGTADGHMDSLHQLRNEYGADMVSLINTNAEYCGIAWLGMNSTAGEMFSVVNWSCAVGYRSFAHELAHNMGAMHDQNQPGAGKYSYSHGHHMGSYRTIMAYAPGTRVGHFSNPDISYQGLPTGTNQRNNALTLNNTASAVAAARNQTLSIGGTVDYAGSMLSGVLAQAGSFGQATSTSEGFLIHGIPEGERVTLSFSKAGYGFSPSSITIAKAQISARYEIAASRLPTIASIPDVGVDSGTASKTVPIDATDPDGDALSFRASIKSAVGNGPTPVVTTIGSNLHLSSLEGFEGILTVTVFVSDGIGETTRDVIVVVGNAPPVITDLGSVSMPQGTANKRINIAVTDTDGDPVTLSAVVLEKVSAKIKIENNQLLLTPPKHFVGTFRVRVIAHDGTLSSSKELLVRVYSRSGHAQDLDGDGWADSDEVARGTDPLDPGSVVNELRGPVYAIWNGFLGMNNILELVNTSSAANTASVSLYAMSGAVTDSRIISVPAQGQFDLILNELTGFAADAYGIVEIRFEKPIDGRVVYYRPGASNDFDFVFSAALTNPSLGESFVGFNTFQPSAHPGESEFVVANWLTVINLDAAPSPFVIYTYSDTGALLFERVVEVPGLGRIDLDGGHDLLGRNQVGIHRIVPRRPTAPYLAQLTRYGGNAGAGQVATQYNFAFPLQAKAGVGRTIFARISRQFDEQNWIEVVNTAVEPTTIELSFYRASGELVGTQRETVAGRGQKHFFASQYLEVGATGIVKIVPKQGGSILAQSMFYFRDATSGSITSMFGSDAQEAARTRSFGSYNLFLEMENWLRLANTTNKVKRYLITVKGAESAVEIDLQVPAYGSVSLPLHQGSSYQTEANSYGTVAVRAADDGKFLASVVRLKNNTASVDFALPTAIR